MMQTHKAYVRYTARLVLAAMAVMILTPPVWSAPDCGFERTAPALESAARSFKRTDLTCAEEEARLFLTLDSITPIERARAHAFLGEVLFLKLMADTLNQRQAVLDEYTSALRSCYECADSLTPANPRLQALFTEATGLVEAERALTEEKEEEGKKGGPFKTIAIIGGAVLAVGAAVIALAGGGDDDEPKPDTTQITIPPYPDHP